MDERFKEAVDRMYSAQSKLRSDEAFGLVDSGDYAGALPLLLECRDLMVDAYPDQGSTPAIEHDIALCYEKLGNKEKAKEAYNNTLEIIRLHSAIAEAFGEIRTAAEEGLKRLQ